MAGCEVVNVGDCFFCRWKREWSYELSHVVLQSEFDLEFADLDILVSCVLMEGHYLHEEGSSPYGGCDHSSGVAFGPYVKILLDLWPYDRADLVIFTGDDVAWRYHGY